MTARLAIGVDIGGTKIAAGLVDPANGTIVERRTVPTDRREGGVHALSQVAALAVELAQEAQRREATVLGVGVGVPELVDRAGIVRSRYNFDWLGQSLAEPIAAALPDPAARIVVESDVRAAARAEALYGAAQGRDVAVYVTIGTGVSYCLLLDGRPFPGAHGYAIHCASSALAVTCAACGAPNEPIVEELASGPALARAYQARTGKADASAETVLAAAANGDPVAAAIVADAARLLGSTIALVVNMLDPEIVVIGGGLGVAHGPYFPALVEEARARIFAMDCRDLPIVPAKLGTDAGIVGAAAFASE